MKETDLYDPVKKWLRAQGCLKVCPEVPSMFRSVDVVGIGEEVVIGVELKLSLTGKVIRQALTLQLACDRVYVAVSTKPRDASRASRHGIGVLRVASGEVEVLSESGKPRVNPGYRTGIIRACLKMSEEGIGGAPSLDGVGPAQDCKRKVDEYRKIHPGVTWKELYEVIPNHYANYKSMRGSLTTGLALRARWKEQRRKARERRTANG